MDVSRAILENLMGRDRNKCKDNITERDHYSNPDVCKPFLVCFCFNTLFPNTIYDQGPCNKRHDTYLKTMFDNDLHRSDYQKEYIKQCIRWIERRLVDVKQKTNKNQGVIDNKSNFPTDRPKQILDRIFAIDQDIEKMMTQALTYGQKGQIDDSARCLEQVQRLRDRRKQIQLMGNDLMNAAKQQKICQICGAIQTINDTEKRIQTHLQGKIHQGFLKLRHQIQTLKIRHQILCKMDPHSHQKKQQSLQLSLPESHKDNRDNRDNNYRSITGSIQPKQNNGNNINNNKPYKQASYNKQSHQNEVHTSANVQSSSFKQKEREREKEKDRRQDRSRSQSKKKKKQRSRQKRRSRSRDNNKDKDKSDRYSRQKQKQRQRQRKYNHNDHQRHRDRGDRTDRTDRGEHKQKDKEYRPDKKRDYQDKEKERYRGKERERQGKDNKDQENRDHKDRDRQSKKKHKKDRSKSYERQKHSQWG